ncbi:MAG: hypothetical protein HY664_06945 [Chloroflexi bacterium]|nr:hypothetical protein [Chloroflexota bacterium]
MTLRFAGALASVEMIEQITYTPGIQDSGDLEPGTKSVVATAKQASPDYSTNLTVPAITNSQIAVPQLGLRLQVTIDSFGGSPAATQLFYSIEVNGVEKATGIWNATGAQYAGANVAADFSLGTANQIKVYLWVDQGNAVVSLCQVWLAVGTYGTTAKFPVVLTHAGLGAVSWIFKRQGSGNGSYWYLDKAAYVLGTWQGRHAYGSGTPANGAAQILGLTIMGTGWALSLAGTVVTDLAYVDEIGFRLRREE